MGNFKLYSVLGMIVLLISLTSASNVAYIYKSSARIDYNFVNAFKSSGLSVDLINEASMPANFSKYNFIYVGDEAFTKNIPVTDYNVIISNSYLGSQTGITDSDGISKLVSKNKLNVNINSKLIQVYTSAVDNRGSSLYYYFLDNDNKASSFVRFAGTDTTTTGNPFGDVVSFVPKDSKLNNKKTAKGYICFFGIIKSPYWTEESKDLLRACINYVNKPLVVLNTNSTNSTSPVVNDTNSTNSNTNQTNTNDSNSSVVVCSTNADCGQNTFSGELSCQNGNVFQNFITYTCSNSGSVQSSCSSSTLLQLKQTCSSSQVCSIGSCVNVVCFSDSSCNDNNSSTEDTCINSGTVDSNCIYTAYGKIKLSSLFAAPLQTSVMLNFSATSNKGLIQGYNLSLDKTNWIWSVDNSYTFNGLTPLTEYTFYVVAMDTLNQSSDEFNVTTTTLSNPNENNSSNETTDSNVTISASSTSGRGGGNGICITQWDCSSWNECKNSVQTRVCSYPDYYCEPTAPKPIERQSCVETIKNTSLNEIIVNNTNPSTNMSSSALGKSFLTGAVIGTLTEHPVWSVLGFLILIAAIYTGIRYLRKKDS